MAASAAMDFALDGEEGDNYVGREEGDDCSRIAELRWLHCGHWIALYGLTNTAPLRAKKVRRTPSKSSTGRDERVTYSDRAEQKTNRDRKPEERRECRSFTPILDLLIRSTRES